MHNFHIDYLRNLLAPPLTKDCAERTRDFVMFDVPHATIKLGPLEP